MHREVTFTPQLEDHFAGQRLFYARYLRRGWGRLIVAAIPLLAVVALFEIVAGLAVGRPLSFSLTSNGPILVALLVVPGVLYWNWRYIPGQVRRMAEQQPSLFSETTWRWDDAMLVAESAAGSSRIEWAYLFGWFANDSSIVVQPQERIILILPRRALTAEQDADLLGALDRFAVKARRS